MTKLLQWIVGGLLSVAVFIALAIVLIPRLIDPNDFRDNIVQLVKQETGRDLRLDGELSISVFPWLGIKTQGLTLSQPAAIGGDMLSMSSAQLRVKLIPLLQQRLEVDTVILEDPNVHLIIVDEQLNSFTGLSKESATDNSQNPTTQITAPQQLATNQAAAETPRKATGKTATVALVVQGLLISNGSLIWEDRTNQQRLRVNSLNVDSDNLLDPQMAPIEISGELVDESDPNNISQAITLSLDAMGFLDADDLSFRLKDLNSRITRQDQQSQLTVAELTMIPGQSLSLGTIRLNTQLSGEPSSSLTAGMPLMAEIDSADYSLETQAASINAMTISGQLASRPIEASIPQLSADLKSETLNAASVTINSKDLSSRLRSLRVTSLLENPSYTAELSADKFSLVELLNDLKFDYQPTSPKAGKSLSMSAVIKGNSEQISFNNLNVRLDNSGLTGNVSIIDFEQLATKFNLVLDQLNLDNYLPKSEQNNVPTVSGTKALAVPMAALKDIDANGEFKAGQIISGGLELNDINVLIASKGGQLTVTPKARLYDGSLDGQFAFTQTSKDAASLKVKNTIDLVSLTKFLTAADVTDQLSGIGFVDMDVDVREQNGIQTKNGTIKLKATNGALQGIDLAKMLERGTQGYELYKQLRGKQSNSLNDGQLDAAKGVSKYSDVTQFGELLGTFVLDNDLLRNNDFSLVSPWLKVNGEGIINLASQTLDYTLSLSLRKKEGSPEELQSIAEQDFNDLLDIPIPIKLSGDIRSPSFSLDMNFLFKVLVDRETEQAKSKYIERKLGIKDVGKLSSKDLLKQVLINEATKKDREKDREKEQKKQQQNGNNSANPQADSGQSAPSNSEPVPYEDYEQTQSGAEANSDEIPDVDATPASPPEPELTEKEKKDQLKKELKLKLLENILK